MLPVSYDPRVLLAYLLCAAAAHFGWRFGGWIAGKLFK